MCRDSEASGLVRPLLAAPESAKPDDRLSTNHERIFDAGKGVLDLEPFRLSAAREN